ncbi:hypothetical protein BGZ83_007219 [Gryganskiella cystojenkinii]|nr:hypothetical protein BGZ83_007219 [Gryganskiella cystojenkinii]
MGEMDLTSRFILPMLSAIFTQMPHCILKHTASVATSGSREKRSNPKSPDMIASFFASPTKFVDIIFCSISSVAQHSKDVGDLCRLLFGGKHALDELRQLFEGLEDVFVLIFQDARTKCFVHKLRSVGDISIGIKLVFFMIPLSMDGIVNLEKDLDPWLIVEISFLELLDLLKSAKRRTSLPPKMFPDLQTLIARCLTTIPSSGTRRDHDTLTSHTSGNNRGSDGRVFRDEEQDSGDKGKARRAMRVRALQKEESPLTELFLLGSKLHTSCKPVTEADHVAGFTMKSCLTNRVDETRLA